MATYEQLQTWFSPDRLDPYKTEAGGDPDLACALYAWNAQLCGAFMEVMHHVEVLVRNRMHIELTAVFPDDPAPWYEQDGIFQHEKGPLLVEETKDRLGGNATVGRVVASLPFGFWNGLLTRHYEDLWRQCLYKCFAGAKGRKDVVAVMERVRLFRNRIAHHERLFHQDLMAKHDDLIKLAMWADIDCRTWIIAGSRVREVIAARPG